MVKILVCALFFLGLSGLEKPKSSVPKNLTVLVFLGVDCPISQDYIGMLNKLQQQFNEQVELTGIIPDPKDDTEVVTFKNEYQVNFELRADKRLDLVKKYHITVTPEIILLDARGKVQYQGAIDNWYYELGRHRPKATEHYLLDAIEAQLAGKKVAKQKTEPIGCILSVPAGHHH
jgi:hypothetical protein